MNFLHLYLIYFYTHGINSPKNSPLPRHISPLQKQGLSKMEARELIFEVLRYLILVVMWIQPVLNLQNLYLEFTELVPLKLKFDADILLDIFQTFSEQLFIRQLWMTAIIYKISYFEKQSLAK